MRPQRMTDHELNLVYEQYKMCWIDEDVNDRTAEQHAAAMIPALLSHIASLEVEREAWATGQPNWWQRARYLSRVV
jgi:hypothetical protein